MEAFSPCYVSAPSDDQHVVAVPLPTRAVFDHLDIDQQIYNRKSTREYNSPRSPDGDPRTSAISAIAPPNGAKARCQARWRKRPVTLSCRCVNKSATPRKQATDHIADQDFEDDSEATGFKSWKEIGVRDDATDEDDSRGEPP